MPFVTYNVDGAHTWSYWRDALRDFLTRVAFRAMSVDVTTAGRSATATVTSSTSEMTEPTGTVQSSSTEGPIGDPQPVRHGVARTAIPGTLGTGESTAAYSGDALYNGSEGSAGQ